VILLPERQPEATRLYLVRHAAPAVEAGRCYGALDVGLSDRGREQARLLSEALGAAPLAAVYTSPLERARQTAAEIAIPHGLVPRRRSGLAEIDFGELEGRPYDEIAATHPDTYAVWMSLPTEVEFPGGERFADFADRVRKSVRNVRLAHESEEVALVTHGGPIRVVIADALAMPTSALFRLDQSFAGLSVIDWVDGHPLLKLLNARPPACG